MPRYLADLHCHVSFKPHYNEGYRPNIDIWEPVPEDTTLYDSLKRTVKKFIKETMRSSQSNMNELHRGKVRGVFMVIHPMERGWLYRRSKSNRPIRKKILKWVLSKRNVPILAASVSGVPVERINDMLEAERTDQPVNYYRDDTYHEYDFICRSEQTSGRNGIKFKIVSSFGQYMNIIQNQPDTIAVILTIEGGHALLQTPKYSTYRKKYTSLTKAERTLIRNKYLLNIQKIKGVNRVKGFAPGHTPFFITIAHFYNNFLLGHAKSYGEGTGIYPGMDDYLDQENAMNTGLTPLGREVIGLLLHKSANERRILIDIKHMSLKAREEYYEILANLKKNGLDIPIIFSHGGINGYTKGMFRGWDTNADNANGYLSHWSINLYDEDIKEIVDSDGIIGLAPHEGRMPGKAGLDIFNAQKRIMGFRDHRYENAETRLRREYVKMMLCNMYHIASVVGDATAWDHISLGTDYDGIMNPFEGYETSGHLRRLMLDIESLLRHPPKEIQHYHYSRPGILSAKDQKRLQFGLSPRTIANKISYGNVERFLKTYFNRRYLGGPAVGRA